MIQPFSSSELAKLAARCPNHRLWAPLIASACRAYGIADSEPRLTMFLATVVHESGELRTLEENLRYSAARLCQVWPRRFTSEAQAQPYAFQPERLASLVYANRMGNGPESSGDGWKYRGRGLIQLTGRTNYLRCGQGLNQPLVGRPDLLLTPEIAALSAAWFWEDAGCNDIADQLDFERVTRRINGGLTGFDDRQKLLATARTILDAREVTA